MAQIGCRIPSFGPVEDLDITRRARGAEEAGARSLWVGDHIVLVRETTSRYPYTPSGRATMLDVSQPFLEAMTTMTWLAAVTKHAVIGSAAIVASQRDPILLAKAAATLDALSGGRVALGLGAGWLEEEMHALGWDFATRGRRLEEAVSVMRACWTGEPDAFTGAELQLPAGLICRPSPSRPDGIPVLIGGMTPSAVRRAGRIGDGWLAITSLDAVDSDMLAAGLHAMRDAARERGKSVRAVVRALGDLPPDGPRLEAVRGLAGLGFDEIIVDLPWDEVSSAQASIRAARAAAGSV